MPSRQSPPASAPVDAGIDRRQAWLWLALGGFSVQGAVQAQALSEAALEAQAPDLPALGSVLRLPDIDLLDGTPFKATAGQPLLVYWWASTCPFCALQSPSMQALWQAQKSRGLNMLALAVDKTPKAAADYLKKHGYSFPAAWASPLWRRQFAKPKGLPVTLLADKQQKLVLAEKGQMFPEDVQDMAKLI